MSEVVRRWRRYPAYKDSGMHSLGEVPAHWQVMRLKYACRLNPSKSEVAHLPDCLPVSFLPMERIGEQGELDLQLSKPLREVRQGFTYFREGDVLVAKITPCFENGKGALASGLMNGVGFGTTELHVLRANEGIERRFLELITRQYAFRTLGCKTMYGAAGQQRVPDSFIADFVAGFPPVAEQRSIVAFLDRETIRIDELIDGLPLSLTGAGLMTRMATLLQEYRTALISAAVTGKIDVREEGQR